VSYRLHVGAATDQSSRGRSDRGVVLRGNEGGRCRRAEYEANHLPADIAFEKAVAGKRAPLRTTFEGNTAWVIGTTEYEGTFEGKPVNFVSAQLMVLSRDTGPWLIRTVHWSSRRR